MQPLNSHYVMSVIGPDIMAVINGIESWGATAAIYMNAMLYFTYTSRLLSLPSQLFWQSYIIWPLPMLK